MAVRPLPFTALAPLIAQPRCLVFQDIDDMDTHTPHQPQQAPALPLHSGRFIAAFALAHVAALLDARLPADLPRIVLHGHVCRRELAVEIDGSHA